ncbi:hypothetical protein [Kamptonema formosum]|uniref:hypothetical protein n=1 Tax=Kamptonema formosum TaxID=331992 RepID=UPI000347648A|nr:hypothetical protein [Oscillatoria sp. PCC 10802]
MAQTSTRSPSVYGKSYKKSRCGKCSGGSRRKALAVGGMNESCASTPTRRPL